MVGYAKAMELIITGRSVDAAEALAIGLANEVVDEGQALPRALELPARSPRCPRARSAPTRRPSSATSGAPMRTRLRQEIEASLSMFWRRDSHAIGASAFKRGEDPQCPITAFEARSLTRQAR